MELERRAGRRRTGPATGISAPDTVTRSSACQASSVFGARCRLDELVGRQPGHADDGAGRAIQRARSGWEPAGVDSAGTDE